MGAYAIANIVLVSIGVFSPGWVGVWCIFLTSFFMSLMFPTIFALGLKGLGPNTKLGGSFLVMAIVGGAVLTPIMGLISEKLHSLAWAYSIPLIAYVCICAYSFLGARRRDLVPARAEDAGSISP
jgi:FHS family L-fucose permease-like MFS transporter